MKSYKSLFSWKWTIKNTVFFLMIYNPHTALWIYQELQCMVDWKSSNVYIFKTVSSCRSLSYTPRKRNSNISPGPVKSAPSTLSTPAKRPPASQCFRSVGGRPNLPAVAASQPAPGGPVSSPMSWSGTPRARGKAGSSGRRTFPSVSAKLDQSPRRSFDACG